MSAAPTVINDVSDTISSNASAVYAPGSINLLDEDYASSGGTLLTTVIPAYITVGIGEIDEQQLIVVYKCETTKTDLSSSIPAALS